MGAPDSTVKGMQTGDTCTVCGVSECECTSIMQRNASTSNETCRWCNQSTCLCQGFVRNDRTRNADDPDEQLVGQIIGNMYEVLAVIGRGGMGTVYKVRHRNLKREYALKMIHQKRGVTKRSLKRFDIEAKAASGLNHPNLITITDYGNAAQGPYIVMSLAEGRPFSDYTQLKQLLPEQAALDVFIQLCDALTHAHGKRIIHRDIKPGNIMIDESSGRPHVRLLDFGVAKLMPEDDNATSNRLTNTGEVVGSPKYMSPEQCLGMKQDGRSDIYSLGCVMYEALTGYAPFDGENAVQVYFRQVKDRAPEFKYFTREISVNPDLELVVLQCLEKSPTDRYQKADDLRKDLLLLKAGKSPLKNRTSRRRIQRLVQAVKPVVLAVTGICFIPALVIGSIMTYEWWHTTNIPSWQKDFSAGISEAAQGQVSYPAAEVMFKKALADVSAAKGPARDREQILLRLARVYSDSGRTDQAIACLNEAISYAQTHKQDLNKAVLYNDLSAVYLKQKHWKKAAEASKTALEIADPNGQSATTLKQSILANLSVALCKQGDFAAAEDACQNNINLCLRLYPSQDHIELADAYRNMAQVLALSAESEVKHGKVKLFADKAIMRYRKLLGLTHPRTKETADWYVKWLQNNHEQAEADAIGEHLRIEAK